MIAESIISERRIGAVPKAEEMTIDELARRTGMTVRNIRAHQSRGLLPPPEVRGRTGYYGSEHLGRIELIRELQADGYKLEAISRLLESAGGASEEVLRFTRAVKAPFEDEQPQIVGASELAGRWGLSDPDPSLLRKAEKLGILRPLGDGNFEELSPRLARASAELAAIGVPAETALEIASEIRKHADAVAKEFTRLFVEWVWKPFEEEGRPEARLQAVRETIERLRPLASDALLAVFQHAMTDAVEERFGRELERLQKAKR
jgi:DNA-binding transcriptional MerR regulator